MTFEYGIGCEPIEKQANRQGYTLGKYAEHIEKLLASYNMLRMNLHKILKGNKENEKD